MLRSEGGEARSGLTVAVVSARVADAGPAGQVRRDGEPLKVDLALDLNVDLRAGEWAVSASLSNLADGRQVWYRRFSHPASDASGARERVVTAVVEALRKNAPAAGPGSSRP